MATDDDDDDDHDDDTHIWPVHNIIYGQLVRAHSWPLHNIYIWPTGASTQLAHT